MADGNRRKSHFEVVIEGVTRKVWMFMGNRQLERQNNKILNKGDDVVVCLQVTSVYDLT